MHANLDSTAVLALWEAGLGQAPPARDAALLKAVGGAAPRTLGERNAMLLGLHARLFGCELGLRSECPGCGGAAEFESDCEALVARLPAAREPAPHLLEADGHRVEFRLPGPADLTVTAQSETADAFALRLLERCVLDCTRRGTRVGVRDLPAQVLDALSDRMEALDPAAAISFALECPQCATRWNASFDAGPALWQKIQAAAERVLLEVDALARAYGWTESEVLNLNPLRRAAYLQLAA